MNRFSKDKIYKKIFQAKKIKISPLTMRVKTKNGTTKRGLQLMKSQYSDKWQAASLKINQGKKQIIKLISDGVLVSTQPEAPPIIFQYMAQY